MSVPSVCQFGVIVLWKRRRRTGFDSELPPRGIEVIVQIFAVARDGACRVSDRAIGIATSTLKVIGIALWKGGVIRHGVDGGVNISVEYAFRNHDKAQSLEALFGVAIWY